MATGGSTGRVRPGGAASGWVTATLALLERYHDAAPRPHSVAEDIGAFTLFVAKPTSAWPYYARPRLGGPEVNAADLAAVLARQRELGVPQALEWVAESCPALMGLALQAGFQVRTSEMLALDRGTALADPVEVSPPRDRTRVAVEMADDMHLSAVLGAVRAGFCDRDEIRSGDAAFSRTRIRAGHSVVVGAFRRGAAIGGGTHNPRGMVSEIVGLAVLPSARRHGVGARIVTTLAADARAGGVETVFLCAEDERSARLYRRLGFRPVGMACVADMPDVAG